MMRIEKADNREKYEGLRDLWCRTFTDDPGLVDRFYDIFEDDIAGYVICEDGKVVSALTMHRCGTMHVPACADAAELNGRPVFVSYAICTDPEYRGRGYAGALTEYAREKASVMSGGISVVSPAETSLIDFYRNLGYEEGFCASRDRAFREDLFSDTDIQESSDGKSKVWGLDDDGRPGFIDDPGNADAFDPGLSVVRISTSMYNKYREAFLADTAHVSLSGRMMEAVKASSLEGDGLYLINNGDAICVLTEGKEASGTQKGMLYAAEFLVNPVLAELSEEIGDEIAARLADRLGQDCLEYSTAGSGRVQAMYAADHSGLKGYYGFPLE